MLDIAMSSWNRRKFLQTLGTKAVQGSALLSAVPLLVRNAAAVQPYRNTGSIEDVAHIVVLTQENRSFDHYFGALRGVCGFSDRFAHPVAGITGSGNRTVMHQPRISGSGSLGRTVQPFHLDTQNDFSLMRGEGTKHSWSDAQLAWDHGRMANWSLMKGEHAMGYYTRADLPFHYALADAFTVCDAYHCSFQGGTNTNRLFLWTGTNDPFGLNNGPSIYNDLDSLVAKPGVPSYTWTTYAERLQAAGVTWQVYQDFADNYEDNPLVGFQVFREAQHSNSGTSGQLRERGMSTCDLAQLKADVMADKLPQVSWIVADAVSSEHPEVSSPAQGAHYEARVLDALTANTEVWRRTVLIINFDENDGYFDHVAPPAPPSVLYWHTDPAARRYAGMSTVSTEGEYHEVLPAYHDNAEERQRLHLPYGLGPRVPMLVISPWSRGGWVNSQVFDHTSVIRFIERRFGVEEPNISPWRRAVCGDLTSAFDFSNTDHCAMPPLPPTLEMSQRAAGLQRRVLAMAPARSVPPIQESGRRPSRALPYELHVHCRCQHATNTVALKFVNTGSVGAVFHVVDKLHLTQVPRRYTVESSNELVDSWPATSRGDYDLWVLGPNGFHRHCTGRLNSAQIVQAEPEIEVHYDLEGLSLDVRLHNTGNAPCRFRFRTNAYLPTSTWHHLVGAGKQVTQRLDLLPTQGWYDCCIGVQAQSTFLRRIAGRMETGVHSISAPYAATTGKH